jgi:beta-galactosidase
MCAIKYEEVPLGRVNLSHRRPTNLKRFWYGAAYYPEHWDEATRARDAERMAAAGMNVVRMAEFAADLMEPRQGEYDFSLFDETSAKLGEKGVHTIMCTPTAAPARWLTRDCPEILRVNADGKTMQHGSRQHCCHASPVLRQWSRAITQKMAEHYRDNPFVIGWQTDNEFHCHFSECHCPNCQKAFVEFLRHKYENDIGKLNTAWGTAFWALTFERFEDITTPKPDLPAYENPAWRLDYCRYLAHTVATFQHEQVAILRENNPDWFVMHNGVIFSHLDNLGLLGQDIDFHGYDCYPFFLADPDERGHTQASGLNRARACGGNFIIPEMQSGPGGQKPYLQNNPEPGEMRKMALLSVAHGADSLLHFRWRTCRFGAEEYWCGILDHDNVPRRRYEEAAQQGRELAVIGSKILGTHVFVDAAVAYTDMEVNDSHNSYPLGLPAPGKVAEDCHRQLWQRGMAVGYVHPLDDLAGIKLYVIPHLAYFDPAWLQNLTRFVENGGTLVIGARTATRDVNNNVVGETLPGALQSLAGITVEEYGRQNEPVKRLLSIDLGGALVPSTLWYEILEPKGKATRLYPWRGRHLDGRCAVSLNQVDKGRVVYAGTYFDDPVFSALLPELIRLSGLQPAWPGLPPRVEAVLRTDGKKNIWFFFNHSDDTVTIPSLPRGKELTTGKNTDGTYELPRYGVAVIDAFGNQ